MSPEERNPAYLWDILEAAQQIDGFMAGVGLEAYVADRKLQLAVERLLEIIGEASRRLSEDYRASHEEIPWQSMIGLRNVLAHEYGDIRNDVVWRVATKRIPELIQAFQRLRMP